VDTGENQPLTDAVNSLELVSVFQGSKQNNYLCTYDLYSPEHDVLDACISITWGIGRGLGPGIPKFFGPCEMGTSQ
jgi:hypothetical protein